MAFTLSRQKTLKSRHGTGENVVRLSSAGNSWVASFLATAPVVAAVGVVRAGSQSDASALRNGRSGIDSEAAERGKPAPSQEFARFNRLARTRSQSRKR